MMFKNHAWPLSITPDLINFLNFMVGSQFFVKQNQRNLSLLRVFVMCMLHTHTVRGREVNEDDRLLCLGMIIAE